MPKNKKVTDLKNIETHVEVEEDADNLEIMIDELESNPTHYFVITEKGVPEAYLISHKNKNFKC